MYEYGVKREGSNWDYGLQVMTEEQAWEFASDANQFNTGPQFYVVRRTVTPWERV